MAIFRSFSITIHSFSAGGRTLQGLPLQINGKDVDFHLPDTADARLFQGRCGIFVESMQPAISRPDWKKYRQKSVSWKIAQVVPYALTTYNEQSWLEIKALYSNDSINLTLFSMRKTTAFLILALLGAPLLVQAETPARQHLFKIERSKNANIVQYDAQIGPDGKLMKKEPVVGYWVRLAEQGQVQKLSWIQKTFAYGFKAKLDSNREKVKLDMVADFGQPIFVVRNGDEYRATFLIEGSLSYLDKIFIQASGKGTQITIEYIEMFGEDTKTGEARYEKFFP